MEKIKQINNLEVESYPQMAKVKCLITNFQELQENLYNYKN